MRTENSGYACAIYLPEPASDLAEDVTMASSLAGALLFLVIVSAKAEESASLGGGSSTNVQGKYLRSEVASYIKYSASQVIVDSLMPKMADAPANAPASGTTTEASSLSLGSRARAPTRRPRTPAPSPSSWRPSQRCCAAENSTISSSTSTS